MLCSISSHNEATLQTFMNLNDNNKKEKKKKSEKKNKHFVFLV